MGEKYEVAKRDLDGYNMYKAYWQDITSAKSNAKAGDVHRILILDHGDRIIEFKDSGKYIVNRHYVECYNEIKYNSSELSDVDWCKEFGSRLKYILYRDGVTAQELAAKLKMSKQTMTRYFQGDCMPTAYTVEKICKILNIVPDDLLLVVRYLDSLETGRKLLNMVNEIIYK